MRRILLIAAMVAVLATTLGAGAALGAIKRVAVEDNSFSPRRIAVTRGTTLRWVWAGRNPHNVAGQGFHSATQKRGTYSRRFRRAGRYRIFCTIHSGMEMTVRVR